jgi:hypothetical protein
MSAQPSSGGSGASGVSEVEADRVGQLFDLMSYVVLLCAVYGGAAAVVSLAVGVPVAPGVKYGFFVFGWIGLLAGALKLRPRSAWKSDDNQGMLSAFTGGSGGTSELESDFQQWVQQIPPARFRPLPANARLSTGSRLLVASICMLAVSFLMEQALGVPG